MADLERCVRENNVICVTSMGKPSTGAEEVA